MAITMITPEFMKLKTDFILGSHLLFYNFYFSYLFNLIMYGFTIFMETKMKNQNDVPPVLLLFQPSRSEARPGVRLD